MKTLLLLRHGKSSWEDPSLKDFDRPLSERGASDAELMGKYARKKKITADLVMSSPATRAKHTTEVFVAAAHWKKEAVYDERIYEASFRKLLRVIAGFDDEISTVLLVGHNPGFQEICQRLTKEGPKVPTASLTCIEFSTEKWSDPKAGKGELKWRMTPKKLKKNGLSGGKKSK